MNFNDVSVTTNVLIKDKSWQSVKTKTVWNYNQTHSLAALVKVQTLKPIILHQSAQCNSHRYSNFSAQTWDIQFVTVGFLTDPSSLGHIFLYTDGPYKKHVQTGITNYAHKSTLASNMKPRSIRLWQGNNVRQTLVFQTIRA